MTAGDAPDAPAGWWRTASRDEIVRAPDTARDFVRGRGPADAEAVTAFARALALLWIFRAPGGPDDVLREALAAVPPVPAAGSGDEALAAAQDWLPRGRAIEAGLVAVLGLLRQPADDALQGDVDRFGQALSSLHDGCLTADSHAGLRASIRRLRPPVLRRP